MFSDRISKYKQLEEMRNTKLLVYVTGDRPGLGTQIHPEVIDYITDHLDNLTNKRKVDKISLFLYTSGGHTLAAWSIINLLKQFCKNYEVIIPAKAHSAGTIIALGANNIIMTKQATLSPIDPSFNGPFNPVPTINTGNITVPVSVEAVNSFFNFIRNDLKIKNNSEITKVLLTLVDKIHPLVLGETYRARTQIKSLAENLLSKHSLSKKQVKKIISFLTEDSGSHDYTINRTEAKETLSLPIEKPDDSLYDIIKSIYDDIKVELELNNPFNANSLFGPSSVEIAYSLRQALIESIPTKSHMFLKEGLMTKIKGQNPMGFPQELVNDQIIFQGWRHEF